MRKEVNEIIREFEEVFEGQPWYGGSISKILKDVTNETAIEKVHGRTHSIIEVVGHVLAWREFTLSKLRGDHALDMSMNDTKDWEEINTSDPVIWARILTRLKENQSLILQELSSWNDKMLEKQVSKRDYNFRYLLHGIIQHDLYHLGQIAILKKALSI